jgi:hypothetical protein
MTIRSPRAILLPVLLAYLAGSLSGLSVYPSVGEDEPWIAAAPYKLARQGVLGYAARGLLICVIRDHTFGTMQVYHLAK